MSDAPSPLREVQTPASSGRRWRMGAKYRLRRPPAADDRWAPWARHLTLNISPKIDLREKTPRDGPHRPGAAKPSRGGGPPPGLRLAQPCAAAHPGRTRPQGAGLGPPPPSRPPDRPPIASTEPGPTTSGYLQPSVLWCFVLTDRSSSTGPVKQFKDSEMNVAHVGVHG